ncbi:zinc finger, CCHC-type containing protein [Tanacetum coccineum]
MMLPNALFDAANLFVAAINGVWRWWSIVTTSKYVVPTGRVKVPAGRYVVPTGKDKIIVSAGRTKVIPASSTILVLHLLIEEQYRLENKSNDDTSKVHVVEEKGESSKAGGKKHRHDDKDKMKSKKNKKDRSLLKKINLGGWTLEPLDTLKGKGKIDLVFTSGNILTLNDVLHVPDVRNLSSNLISSSSPNVASSLSKAITPVEYEVLEKFKIYKNEVELKCDTRIKCLWTDRGGEYYDPRYFQSTGIVHQVTAPYTPHQNGIAERKNRTLMDMVNSMMSHSGLSSGYWGEALLIACYILNRVPSKRNIKTPYELWNRRTPKPDYLHIWGYLPPGSKAIKSKWIFKRKLRVDGSIEKFKARLVAKGFTQREGLDYFDTYAPVARTTTIRILIALASINKLIIHQMDVKTAFLNGELEEEVYMEQPEGFVIQGQENKVCKLIKSLYGLKQAPKQWHQKFDQVILSNGFRINESDKCVYSRFVNGKGVIICLYVDDMLIFGTDLEQVQMTKKLLSENFDMKDLGEADVILGIKILRKENRLMLTQSHYIEKILKRFDSFNCLPVSTPFEVGSKLTYNTARILAQNKYAKVIGSLMYAMTCTRPDIAYAVGRLSRHTSSPGKEHWDAVNRVFKYLKKTMDYGLEYNGDPSVLEGYTDASWITDQEDYASTSGWIFTLGGGAVSWGSKKQSCLTDSTMAAEFVALASCCKEAEWLRDLLINIPLWSKPMPPISVHYDSQSTLSRAYNQVYNGKSRHIGLRHRQVNQLINDGVITVSFLRSSKNLADPFTKGLPRKLIESTSQGMRLNHMYN